MQTDPLLRRVERTAIVLCLAMSAAALVIARGRPGPAFAVLGGGLLIGVSYWSIGSGVAELVRSAERAGAASTDAPPASPRSGRRTVLKLAGRYALLALLAYVMIARLRMHPLALLAGASSFVAAVSVEAVRLLAQKPRS